MKKTPEKLENFQLKPIAEHAAGFVPLRAYPAHKTLSFDDYPSNISEMLPENFDLQSYLSSEDAVPPETDADGNLVFRVGDAEYKIAPPAFSVDYAEELDRAFWSVRARANK